jgi:hypothetical protein
MPSFRQYDVPVEAEVEVNINVEVNEFLDECDEDEIKDVIEYLVEKGYIQKDFVKKEPEMVSATEQEFITALVKLHNKWNVLSKDEENYILNTAKRF